MGVRREISSALTTYGSRVSLTTLQVLVPIIWSPIDNLESLLSPRNIPNRQMTYYTQPSKPLLNPHNPISKSPRHKPLRSPCHPFHCPPNSLPIISSSFLTLTHNIPAISIAIKPPITSLAHGTFSTTGPHHPGITQATTPPYLCSVRKSTHRTAQRPT